VRHYLSGNRLHGTIPGTMRTSTCGTAVRRARSSIGVEVLMTAHQSSVFLRRTLLLDAAISGATGVLLCLGATALESWLAVPSGLLRPAGVILLPFAAAVAVLATRPAPSRPAVIGVIAANALWSIASGAILLTGHVSPTLLGVAFVLAQAVAVLGFAELQWIGLRRADA
jgi:hypothetical protein